MSKTDDLRAMRDAKYARVRANAGRPDAPAAKATPAKPAPVAPPVRADDDADGADGPVETDAVCGHRNMSGRTCTREQGHAAKSHRYS